MNSYDAYLLQLCERVNVNCDTHEHLLKTNVTIDTL